MRACCDRSPRPGSPRTGCRRSRSTIRSESRVIWKVRHMGKALPNISNRARLPEIIEASSDHALDEFPPEAPSSASAPPPSPAVAHREPPLFKRIDERAPAVDLATYEIQSVVPPPARLPQSHPRAARVAQALVGALLVVTVVRAYQIYAPAHSRAKDA